MTFDSDLCPEVSELIQIRSVLIIRTALTGRACELLRVQVELAGLEEVLDLTVVAQCFLDSDFDALNIARVWIRSL